MFARTQRLLLRPGWPEDAPALAQAIGHREVIRNLARVPWPYHAHDAVQYLSAHGGPVTSRFLIFDTPAEAPRLIGGIGIQPGEHPDDHDLGYWLAPDAWGRGYATEAGRQMVDIARHALGLRRLQAFHFLDNPASGRVLTKLGFRPTGRIEPRPSRGRGGHAPAASYILDLVEDRRCEARMAA